MLRTQITAHKIQRQQQRPPIYTRRIWAHSRWLLHYVIRPWPRDVILQRGQAATH